MLDLTLQQSHILDQPSKMAYWLFDITYNGGLDSGNWTDVSSKSFGGNTYTFKVVRFSDIILSDTSSANGMCLPSSIEIEITNALNSIDPDTLLGGDIDHMLVMSANLGYVFAIDDEFEMETGWSLESDDDQEALIMSWRWEIIDAYHHKKFIHYSEDRYSNLKLLGG